MPLPGIPVGLEARCETAMQAALGQLAVRQPAWRDAETGEPDPTTGIRRARGTFAQLLRTHVVPPSDGAERASDNLAARAAATWPELGVALPATLPLGLEVHVHDGPLGIGYTLIGTLRLAGRTWRKAIHVGPYGYMAHDWARVETEL